MGLDMGKMMKQIQKVQSNMVKLQEELAERTVEASAGGGMVRVVMTGKMEVRSIEISKEAIDPDDPEMLQDMVVACVNEGIREAREMVSSEMSRITGGLNIPGLI